MTSSQKLKGRRALVTGAGKRIGQAIAIGLAQSGCDVAVHFHTSRAGAIETKQQIEACGRRAELLEADLMQPKAIEELAENAIRALGGLDILINNASIFPQPETIHASSDLFSETYSGWERSLSINARAPFFLIQYCANALMASTSGNIINILDTSASEPFVSRAAHSISKSALATVTQLAAKTLYSKVRVNALELGAILPPEELAAKEQLEIEWAGVGEVVQGVRFILEADFLHGEIIRLDKGVCRFDRTILG